MQKITMPMFLNMDTTAKEMEDIKTNLVDSLLTELPKARLRVSEPKQGDDGLGMFLTCYAKEDGTIVEAQFSTGFFKRKAK